MEPDITEQDRDIRYIRVRIESIPSGADVYFIEKTKVDRDPGILDRPQEFCQLREGTRTPVEGPMMEQRYWFVGFLNGQRSLKQVDVWGDAPVLVGIVF